MGDLVVLLQVCALPILTVMGMQARFVMLANASHQLSSVQEASYSLAVSTVIVTKMQVKFVMLVNASLQPSSVQVVSLISALTTVIVTRMLVKFVMLLNASNLNLSVFSDRAKLTQ